ncbi:leucine-rich repeat-containing protein 36 [Paroedura picta]|uniref:leucine-rich repeat-containing protein 36 n=1 Tax=Paroedura picta TaxID=143630 RepID=UPI00405624CE
MAPELELSEAWLRDQPALRGLQPEQVDSLSLQGTYAGKIVSVADGLKSFKKLKTLDLSKNLLESLEGLESLQLLERLNLYYNRISSLLEVARLQTLPRLRELDLRLNPVTRNESDYRLFTVSKLQALAKLDDRTIRENERKAAHLQFSRENKENLSHEEASSEHTMRSQIRDQEIFAMSDLDTENVRTVMEPNLCHSPHHHMSYHDGKNSVKVPAASMLQSCKSTKEHMPHSLHMQADDIKGRHFLGHQPLDSEHKLLSSSPQGRTSLHSQVRNRAGSGKGRLHVSFSEDCSSDFSHGEKETGRKLDLLDFGQDASPSRSLNDGGKLNPHGLTRDLRPSSYECLCFTSSTTHKELLKRLADDRKAADNILNYNSKVAKEALAATRSSCGDFRGQYLEIDSDPESSLKYSSDAKLNSHFLPLSIPPSSSLGDFQPKYRSLLDEMPLEDSQLVSGPLSVAHRGQEPPVSRSLSPSRMNLKHSRSPTHCFKEFQCNEQRDGHYRTESPHSAEKSSPVIVVLRQLLDLVDHYWDGSGSLLLNKDFLAPARDLLMCLMTAAPSQQDGPSTAVATPSSNSTGIHYRIPKDLPKCPQHFLGVDKPRKPEESQVASFKGLSGEASAALNYDPQGKFSVSYDELLSQNEHLSAQVDVLTSELKQLKNQQDTINLLRESQKSLVSTNSFLLQQLNREQGPSPAKGALFSEKTTTSAKAPFFERTFHHSPPSSAFGSSHLCSSQQLSSCPL